MRVLIAAGGTGGHIYPGIAVAQEIMRRDQNAKVTFVGTPRGLESRLVPQAGFDLSLIDSAGLKNVSAGARMRGALLLPRSFLSAWHLLGQFKPDVVVGAGGYVSGPVVLTAALTGRSTLIMESNAMPGWTNRVLARFVDRAAVSFTEALPYFRKGRVTGNPVRKEFFEVQPKQRDSSNFSLLVFGGSQGARAINESMVAALSKLNGLRDRMRIKHQTGTADFEKVRAGYNAAGWQGSSTIVTYIDNMVTDVAEADLIVCRAGATTTAELIAAGKASVMIPFPFAADDHQTKNAEAMQKAGGALMIRQSELTPEGLATEISRLVNSPETVSEMEKASKSLSHGDAASAVVDMISELTGNRRQ